MTFDTDTWNTYQNADTYGSLIQPPADLVSLLPLAGAVEHSETEGGQAQLSLISDQLRDRANLVLTQTRYLSRQYAAVVANPPYMGSGNMGNELKKLLLPI